MKQRHTPLKLMISGAAVAAALAVVGVSASAQTATTTTTTSAATAGNLTTASGKTPPTSATPQMVQEACQRSKARRAKFLQSGIPERFGSEEPFTFDPKTPC
jgi:hypothetical protein